MVNNILKNRKIAQPIVRFCKLCIINYALCIMLFSCVKYEADPFTGKTLPRRTGYATGVTNDWMYFNLETGEIFNKTKPSQDIKEGEQKNRTDWDLAFCGYALRTNSGTSGKGLGGAMDLGKIDYYSIKSLSDLPSGAKWLVDNDSTVVVTMSQNDWNKYLIDQGITDFNEYPWFDPNEGPQRILTSANPVLSLAIDMSGPPMTYTPSYHVYVVRSADGMRYYKLHIVSWFHGDVIIGDEGGRISYYLDELK